MIVAAYTVWTFLWTCLLLAIIVAVLVLPVVYLVRRRSRKAV
jgi:hypothetical protein